MGAAKVIGVEVAVRWAILLGIALVLQIGLVTQVHVFGVVPDIMVVLAVCAGLTGGPQRGAVVGFWAGFLFDMPRTLPILGVSALAYCLVAFIVGTAQVVVLQSGRLMSTGIVAVGSALGVLLFAVMGEIFGESTLSHPRMWSIVLVAGLVGAATSRIGLRVAGWADGPETRSVAE